MLEIYFTFPFIVKICISIRYNSSNFFILQFNPRQDPNYLNLQKEKKKKKNQICNNKIKNNSSRSLRGKGGTNIIVRLRTEVERHFSTRVTD